MMTRSPKWRAAGVAIATLALAAACGSNGAGSAPSPTVATPSTAPTSVYIPTPIPEDSPSPSEASASATVEGGRVIQVQMTNSDGYVGILRLTFHPMMYFDSKDNLNPFIQPCVFLPSSNKQVFATMQVDAQLIPVSTAGFTWPSDAGAGAIIERENPSSGKPQQDFCNNGNVGGVVATPAAPRSAWLVYTADVTPNHPHGWDKTLPWASIEFQVGTIYDKECMLVSKDRAFTEVPLNGVKGRCNYSLITKG